MHRKNYPAEAFFEIFHNFIRFYVDKDTFSLIPFFLDLMYKDSISFVLYCISTNETYFFFKDRLLYVLQIQSK